MSTEFDCGFGLSSMDCWRLCDALTVVQAALLLAGIDPSEDGIAANVDNWAPEQRPLNYQSARAALEHAVRRRILDAAIIYHETSYDERSDNEETIYWAKTTILISDRTYA